MAQLTVLCPQEPSSGNGLVVRAVGTQEFTFENGGRDISGTAESCASERHGGTAAICVRAAVRASKR